MFFKMFLPWLYTDGKGRGKQKRLQDQAWKAKEGFTTPTIKESFEIVHIVLTLIEDICLILTFCGKTNKSIKGHKGLEVYVRNCFG